MRRSRGYVGLALTALLLAFPSAAAADFVATGNMIGGRINHGAVLLPDGNVLVAGGFGPIGGGYVAYLDTAELYDPATGSFASTGGMAVARSTHTQTLLQDGTVLIAGGTGGIGSSIVDSAEIYDPASRSFAPTGALKASRSGHTSTLLSNGKVVIVGGLSGFSFTPTATAELYDPSGGTFTLSGSMSRPRFGHTATLLPSGMVLIAGGSTALGTFNTASAELFDPSTGTFASAGAMSVPRGGHTATLLPSGKVLVTGGSGVGTDTLASVELYDPASGAFAPAGDLLASRSGHTSTLLADGEVLVAGGQSTDTGSYVGLESAELYDHATGVFAPAGDMSTARRGHTATLLANGNVLLAGLYDYDGGNPASAELFRIDGAPPSIAAPTEVVVNATTPAGATVAYTVTATDDVDGTVPVACAPPSGSTFPTGDTVVNCTATDAAGNSATASFTVHVKGASEQVADLIVLVDSYNLRLLGTALHDKLVKVQEFLAANKPKRACERLDSFLAQVKEQRGKRISVEQADRLTLDARRIRAVIGC